MGQKRTYKQYSKEYKEEAVALVLEQGYSVPIRDESSHHPVTVLCREMRVSTSAYYAWKKRPGQLITAETLHLHRRMKALFKQSRNSLGSREMMKKLREEGIETGRYKVRKLMKILKLKVTQRIAYKVTTKRNHNDNVTENLLNQNFNPVAPNQVWAGDITYLKTGEGWLNITLCKKIPFCY